MNPNSNAIAQSYLKRLTHENPEIPIAHEALVFTAHLNYSIGSLKRIDELMRQLKQNNQDSFSDLKNKEDITNLILLLGFYIGEMAAISKKTTADWYDIAQFSQVFPDGLPLANTLTNRYVAVIEQRIFKPIEFVLRSLFREQDKSVGKFIQRYLNDSQAEILIAVPAPKTHQPRERLNDPKHKPANEPENTLDNTLESTPTNHSKSSPKNNPVSNHDDSLATDNVTTINEQTAEQAAANPTAQNSAPQSKASLKTTANNPTNNLDVINKSAENKTAGTDTQQYDINTGALPDITESPHTSATTDTPNIDTPKIDTPTEVAATIPQTHDEADDNHSENPSAQLSDPIAADENALSSKRGLLHAFFHRFSQKNTSKRTSDMNSNLITRFKPPVLPFVLSSLPCLGMAGYLIISMLLSDSGFSVGRTVVAGVFLLILLAIWVNYLFSHISIFDNKISTSSLLKNAHAELNNQTEMFYLPREQDSPLGGLLGQKDRIRIKATNSVIEVAAQNHDALENLLLETETGIYLDPTLNKLNNHETVHFGQLQLTRDLLVHGNKGLAVNRIGDFDIEGQDFVITDVSGKTFARLALASQPNINTLVTVVDILQGNDSADNGDAELVE